MATLHDNDNTLLALVRTTFDAHSAVLFLPDQSGNYTVALSSTDNEPSVQEVTIAPGKGLVGWILRHKQPVIVNNLDMRHTFLGYYDENDEGAISAFMGCHIPEGGALCVDSVRPRAYTEEDQLPLHRFARHLARQVHSAGLACDAEDLRRYFTRLEQLSELSAQNPHWRDYLGAFLRLMAESTEFEYVAFATAQEGGSTYKAKTRLCSLRKTVCPNCLSRAAASSAGFSATKCPYMRKGPMVLPVRRSSASCRESPTSNPSCASPCISIKSPAAFCVSPG